MSEIVTDLYAMNKMLVAQLPELSKERKEVLSKAIGELALIENGSFKYLMLLSNEKKDYTLFALRCPNREEVANKLAKEVIDCLEER